MPISVYNGVTNFVEEHPYISAGIAVVSVVGVGIGAACGCFALAGHKAIERLAAAGIAKKVI